MDKYQILVKEGRLGSIIEDWMYNGTADITLIRAKTMGCRLIETVDPIFASRIVTWLQAAEQVNIVKQQQ